MSGLKEFEKTLREEISGILRRTYRTNRHGAHPTDKDEFLRHREFWPDMRFDEAELRNGSAGSGVLLITFTPANEPQTRYGYRVNIADALAKWTKRVIAVDPLSNPSMFATEIVWYMVAYIGSNDIEAMPLDGAGVRWINTGMDLFERLPEPPGFPHPEHAPAT
jgi:hypothetical protein